MSEPLTITIDGQEITADMDEWRAVQRQIFDRQVADRRAWEDEQRAAGQVWHAEYWRYYSQFSDEHFSARDAAGQLQAGSEAGDCSPIGVRLPDGTLVEDYESLLVAAGSGVSPNPTKDGDSEQ